MAYKRSSLVFFGVSLWRFSDGLRQRRTAGLRGDSAQASFHVRVLKDHETCEVLEAEWGQVHRLASDRVVESDPMFQWTDVDDDSAHSPGVILDFWGPAENMTTHRALEVCGGNMHEQPFIQEAPEEDTEVRRISGDGDSENRIDVVFMGDGYTMGERGRFFEDMERLKSAMFADETLRSYLPVFNLWAIHVPSIDSGLGYNSRSLRTPFELYKQGQQHRGVLPTGRGMQKARLTCKLAGGCDYPSLIANDDFYGGLGGEFVIGTRSKTTGTIVLRHEMGHNFVSVGEEYDNGGVYRGVNSQGTRWWGGVPSNRDIKWKHWLTEPNKPAVEQKMKIALTAYPWKDMAEGKQTFTFDSDGTFSRWKMSFTISGYPEPGSLKVFLDGEKLNWVPTSPVGAERPDGHTVDRQFYYHGSNSSSFSKGKHTLTFESVFPPPSGAPIRQLCSITIHEFGSPSEFNDSSGYVGLYPTWSQSGRKSYRPTNDQCLMRDMESTLFCPVCREGMWLQFLSRMTLLDGVDVSSKDGQTTVQMRAVGLAQLRAEPVPGLDEKYTVEWLQGGKLQPDLQDKFSFTGATSQLKGNWVANLQYTTSEVRSDPRGLLRSSKSFTV